MDNYILLIKVGKRDKSAIEVQRVLTEYGRAIKVRLGLHDFDENSSNGLIVLQVTTRNLGEEIQRELTGIPETKIELVTI